MIMWRRLFPYLALTFLCVVVFGSGFTTLPPLDRDESRFAQASKQMLETGDFVRIQFQNTPRNKKPAGAYWLQAASAAAFGGPDEAPIWAYRLPSAIAAWLSVLAVFGFAGRVAGRETGFLAATLLAVSLLVVGEAHQAKTDALLLLTVVLAMGSLGRAYAGIGDNPPIADTWINALVFWAAIGFGVLVKGPITPLVAGLAILALGFSGQGWRWLRALRPLAGLPLALAIAAPWFWAISTVTDGGFLGEAVKSDLLPKLMGSQESHGAPPGYYTALAAVTFWPGSLFLLPTLAFAWHRRKAPLVRFLLAWLIPTWIIFELVPTKLPHYVLPAYPALALLTALTIAKTLGTTDNLRSRLAKAGFLLWGVPGVALAGLAVAGPVLYGSGVDFPALAVSALALAVTAAGIALAWRGQSGRALRVAVIGGAVTSALVLQIVAPRLDALWLSPRAAAAAKALNASHGPVAVAGYHEPSLVFLLGTETRLVDGGGAAGCLAAPAGTCLALVGDQEMPAFRKAIGTLGIAPEEVARVSGFNYSRGKPVTLTFYRAHSVPAVR